MMIFDGTVCRDGKGGIPVKSRCKCGNPDRDCTEKNSFLQREINEKRNWRQSWKIPLVTSRAAAAESEMKAGGTLYSIFFKLLNDYFKDNVFRDGMGLGGMDCETVIPEKPLTPRFNRNHPV